MQTVFLFRWMFQIRRLFRQQPLSSSMVLVSGILLTAASLGYAYTQVQATQINQTIKAAQSSSRTTQLNVPSGTTIPTLPIFDSAQFASSLYEFADDAKLDVDEINYNLDDTANQPYLRYRVSLTVSNNYQSIRQFVKRFQDELAHSSIDSISCNRENITSGALNCDLALSVFFRKTSRG